MRYQEGFLLPFFFMTAKACIHFQKSYFRLGSVLELILLGMGRERLDMDEHSHKDGEE